MTVAGFLEILRAASPTATVAVQGTNRADLCIASGTIITARLSVNGEPTELLILTADPAQHATACW